MARAVIKSFMMAKTFFPVTLKFRDC